MQEDTPNERTQFIVCPQCGGSGQTEKGPCSDCNGYGLGAFYDNHFLYWNKRFTSSGIRLKRTKKKLDIFVDIIAYIIALSGIAALVWWVWQNTSLEAKELFFFWQTKHELILCFWISVLAWLFLVYRKWQEALNKKKIRRLKSSSDASIPNNWEELRQFEKVKDVSSAFGNDAMRVVENAYLLAKKYNHKEVSPLHILLSLLGNKNVKALFIRLNVDNEDLKDKLKKQLNKQEQKKEKFSAVLSEQTEKSLIQAFIEAYEYEQQEVQPLNIITYIIERDETLKEVMLEVGTDAKKIGNTVEWFKIDEQIMKKQEQYKKMAAFKPKTKIDRAYTAVATPTLDKFGYDLTLAAKWGRAELCVGRAEELNEIFETLSAGNNGVLLTGPEGVGKKTVIHGIARAMVKEQVPDFMRDKRLVELDVARLTGGIDSSHAQERLLTILDEIRRAGNIILYIKNIDNMAKMSAEEGGGMELSEVLADSLNRYNIICFATVRDKDYFDHIEESSLNREFFRIKIKEPAGDQAIHILESKIGGFEAKFKVFYTYNAIEEALNLSARYIHNEYLPIKAIKILERSGALASSQSRKQKFNFCGKKEVRQVIQEMTDIPMKKIGEEETDELLNLEENIHKYFIDQEEAVEAVANSLRRARTQMRDKNKTIANFLFLGPTGVGKTKLTKTVSKVYFGSEKYMIRLDMSEYQHEDGIKKLIGDGKEIKGNLAEAVKQKPYSLILLDEFEKAHPKILTLFLQIMDEGRLTDGEGDLVDFKNSLIVATSNVASGFIQEQIKKGVEAQKIKEKVINEKLNQVIPPELINRFDNVIVFKPLSQRHVIEITELILEETRRMLKDKRIKLEINGKGLEKLAEEGFDPQFGARPIRRLVQKKVNNEIAKKILAGKLERRDTVVVNQRGDIEIKKAKEL
ncbi:MAG: AAA family ATPase [Patescibacteria group bacterium]